MALGFGYGAVVAVAAGRRASEALRGEQLSQGHLVYACLSVPESSYLGQPGSSLGAAGVRRSELAGGGGRLQPDSSRWALEVSYNHLAYQDLTRTFVRVGRGQVSYAWPRPRLTLVLLCITGPVDERGTVHLGQVAVGQNLPNSEWHPR